MQSSFDDTIIAPATIPGTGALSLIRISGPDALSLADKLIKFAHGDAAGAKANTVKFGTISLEDGSLLDEVLCNIYRSPHSYTSEDSVEIMCHASPFIVSSILELSCKNGARLAHPGEFTQRAFLAGKMDLSQAEAVADVISASTSSAHHLAFNQLKGGIKTELDVLRGRLLEMASLLELELDFSEEDVEFASRSRLNALLGEAISHIDQLVESFKLGNAIKKGVPVAIVGPANAGKSTLLNNICGEERSIVSPIPGTTRDTIEQIFNYGGIMFRLIDTAGIREISSTLSSLSDKTCQTDCNDSLLIEKIGMKKSFESISKASIVIVVADISELLDIESVKEITLSNTSNEGKLQINKIDAYYNLKLNEIISKIDTERQKLIIALNKADKLGKIASNVFVNLENYIVSLIKNQLITQIDTKTSIEVITISAKQGKGLEELLEVMSNYENKALTSISYESSVISSARHFEALSNARKCLETVRKSLSDGTPSELAAEDLRDALRHLASITGEITSPEILENIFGKFCIGK